MNALSNGIRKRIVEYYETISSTLSASTAQYFMEGEAIHGWYALGVRLAKVQKLAALKS